MVLMPEVVDVGKDTIIRRSLRGGSKTELINKVWDSSVVEGKNCWRESKL